VLDKIVEAKRKRIEKGKLDLPLEKILRQLERADFTDSPSFIKEIKKEGYMAIIGEIKKASPSKGIIRDDFDPEELASTYKKAGVDAISVLTESDFFLGDDIFPSLVRRNCELPILRKDFLFDLWQIYHSKLIGAQAILLIVSILDKGSLKHFIREAKSIGLDCLVEAHNRSELDTALEAGASIIGINNRDLKDFSVSIKTTQELIRFIPEGVVTVSESGIDISNVKAIKDMGVDAILVGEAFMRKSDVFEAVREMRKAYA